MSAVPDFSAFFMELWGYEPFPWQAMLAERVAAGNWPQALDLPTAAGKTACIDVAIYALASQAARPVAQRTAPRRIWFVVDRRIVVDEAHSRAETIARKLEEARDGPLHTVAEILRKVAGTDRPLAVARLRGGIFRDDGWARAPSQPAVISSTVDQVGSRLLFRRYGPGQLAAPIYAGLAANDSLIILDEAHCSVPFLQTLRAVAAYRSESWAECPVPTPFSFAVLSATPPPDIPPDAVFPGADRERALDHPVLHERLKTSKLAELVEVKARRAQANDPLVAEAAARACGYVEAGRRRVGVMVNRVRTAEDTASALRERIGEDGEVVVLTGRMRPFERDRLTERWKPYLKAASPEEPPRPIVVVSTQCLEVGADFSFDALVSEAASLDALRQRFGRLARMGSDEPALATVVARERDVEAEESDFIYGEALAKTWSLLRDGGTDHAEGKGTTKVFDFGVEALAHALREVDDLRPYLAPTADAPVLLPAHIDLLCQTAPRPYPEPDVELFLHGKDRGAAEVQVVWRADLVSADSKDWREIVVLCPPSSGEMLSLPLYRLKSWLARRPLSDESPDIEGVEAADGDGMGGVRPCLLWRGRDRSKITMRADEIRPGDVVVVPAAYGIEGLGQSAVAEALGERELDLWEPVQVSAGRAAAVRLHRAVLGPWLACPPLRDLVALAEDPAWDREGIQDGIDAVLNYQPVGENAPALPPLWWLELLGRVRNGRMQEHPGGGLVIFGRGSAGTLRTSEPDLFADDDDVTSASSREVSLDEHSRLVDRTVTKLAQRCLPEDLITPLSLAAYWHDAGKLDERFQILLCQGDELAAASQEAALAKSASLPTSPAHRRAIREASGLPDNFRHEMLSLEIAERYAPLADSQADLVLHLIASHHGHARPFAPISDDPSPPAVAGCLGDVRIDVSTEARDRNPPPHRFDSGPAERFWRLVRRHGWWGLAYLEAMVRLGDWYASRLAEESEVAS